MARQIERGEFGDVTDVVVGIGDPGLKQVRGYSMGRTDPARAHFIAAAVARLLE
jgi:hypothetical protein